MNNTDIICVEDNEDFRFFIKKALDKSELEVSYDLIESGEAVIQKLKDSKIKPKLIFLDINLPEMSGFEVLQYLRAQSTYKYIPVVIFSSSDHPADIKSAYDLGANAFISKPNGFKKIVEVLHDTSKFWLMHNYSSN